MKFFYIIIIFYIILLSIQLYLIGIEIYKEKNYLYLIGFFSSICGIIITIIKLLIIRINKKKN